MNLKIKTPQRQRIRKLERGQSLVEMSIGFVLLLIILSGLLDIGRAYFVYIAMEDGAGEAALYLAINPECVHATDALKCADPNNAEFRASHAGGLNLDWSSATITVDRPALYSVGTTVSVTISYKMKLISPFVPRFAGINPITMTAQASQVIIREKS